MSAVIVERRRSGSDIVIGALVVVAGLFVLGDALFASTVAVSLIGAVTLGAGAVLLIGLVLIGLGLYVLFGPATIQMQVIGVLIGVQVVIEGLTLITLGRVRVLTR